MATTVATVFGTEVMDDSDSSSDSAEVSQVPVAPEELGGVGRPFRAPGFDSQPLDMALEV